MGDVVEAIGTALGRLHHLRDRTIAQVTALDRMALEPSAYVLLSTLISSGPLRSGALADELMMDPSTVSRHVAQLVSRGLIERQADPSDGRVSLLAATDTGRAKALRIRKRRNANLGSIVADWPEAERAEFARLLAKFVDGYETRRPAMLSAILTDKEQA